MSAAPTPEAEAPAAPVTRTPVLDVLVRVLAAVLVLASASAVFGIVYDYCRHTPQIPAAMAILLALFSSAICGPALVILGRVLGEATYPRALLAAFAVAGVIAWIVGAAEGSGWFVAAPLPLIATGATAAATRRLKP